MSFIPAIATSLMAPAYAGVAAMQASPALGAAAGALGGAAIAGSLTAGAVAVTSGQVQESPAEQSAVSTQDSAFMDGSNDSHKIVMPVRDVPLPLFDHDIYHFLETPVKLQEIEWLVGTAPVDFNPWFAYFSNAAVQRKLANYGLISGKLRVRVVCNGNAYQYGKAVYGYLPHNNQYRLQTSGLTQNTISNLPLQIHIDASKNTVFEVDVPWLLRREAPLNTILSVANTLGFFTPYVPAPLATVSTGLLSPYVTITWFASLHDVKLQFKSQYVPASDYKGVLSKPLQQASQKLSAFKEVPMIGKYADTFSKMAGTASSLTTLMGFSAPNNVTQVQNDTIKLTGNLATTIMPDTGTVLATDPRAVTIMDPAILGLPPTDEMVLSYLVQKETHVASYNWSDLAGSDDIIAQIPVTPHFTTQTMPFAPSHVSYHTLPFNFYRGSLRFRFVIPCTTFHSGRLQFAFEPLSTANLGLDWTNTTMNVVMDLKESSELVFEIPYAGEYLAQQRPQNWSTWADLITATTIGSIQVKVISGLRAGGVSSTLKLLTYISAGPDWELMGPSFEFFRSNDGTTALTHFPLAVITALPEPFVPGYIGHTQTGPGFAAAEPDDEIVPTSETTTISDEQAEFVSTMYSEMIASERILSWRNLIKRYQPGKDVKLTNNINAMFLKAVSNRPAPAFYVRQSNGNTYETGEQMNFINYLAPCYFGARGGMRHKYVDYSQYPRLLVGQRSDLSLIPGSVVRATTGIGLSNAYTRQLVSGMEVVRSDLSSLEFTLPYITRVYCLALGNPEVSTAQPCHLVGGVFTAQNETLSHFVAAADDFTFMFYLGPPVLFSSIVVDPQS